MNIIQIEPNTLEWLQARKSGIGGSDAAASIGLSRWKTPYQLWQEKLQPFVDNNPSSVQLRLGHVLEPFVRQLYTEETGNVVRVPEGILQHSTYLFMLATIDGFVSNDTIVEIKTAKLSYEWGESGTDEVPVNYLIQCQHNMCVAKAKICHLVVWFKDIDQMRIYIIKADEELQQMLVQRETTFWECVQSRTEPPLQLEDMNNYYPKSRDSEILADVNCLNLIEEITRTRQEIKLTEKELEEHELWLKEFMGENERLIDVEGNTLVSWKTTKPRKTVNSTKLRKEKPEIYNEYLRESKSQRRFIIK